MVATSTPSPTSPPTGCFPTPASPLQAGCQLCSSFRGSLWKRLQLSWLQTSESACDGWCPGKMARGQVQAERSGTQDLLLSPPAAAFSGFLVSPSPLLLPAAFPCLASPSPQPRPSLSLICYFSFIGGATEHRFLTLHQGSHLATRTQVAI